MSINDIGSTAKDLARNPLGIVALFIVLVYGFACLLFWGAASALTPDERLPMVWFIVLFPFCVLGAFAWLVSRHPDKLYSPTDYRDDKSFLEAIQLRQIQSEVAVNATNPHIDQLMSYGQDFELIKRRIDAIEADLKSKGIDATSPTEKILIRHLAGAQLLAWFERVYAVIFGSQIALLKALASGKTFSASQLEEYFKVTRDKNKPQLDNWDLDSYLQFLYSTELVSNNNGEVQISATGQEFLKLLEASGYSDVKAL